MHRFKNRPSGFSLVELVIVVVIIGLLAAIAIPRFSRGAAGATESAVRGDLAVLRNAIEMYAAEHNGTYPAAGTFVAQLTTYTNAAGGTSATKTGAFVYGPYLRQIPALKGGTYAGATGIEDYTTAGAPAAESGTATNGWLYKATTGEIWANETDYITW